MLSSGPVLFQYICVGVDLCDTPSRWVQDIGLTATSLLGPLDVALNYSEDPQTWLKGELAGKTTEGLPLVGGLRLSWARRYGDLT